MREVFKVFYQSPNKSIGAGLAFLAVGIILWLFGLLFVFKIKDVGGAVSLFSIGCVFIFVACVPTVSPFNAIRRFKKEFGFLPPTIPEARCALQREIDYRLGLSAESFLFRCSEEKRNSEILKGFASGQVNRRSAFQEDVANFEKAFYRNRKYLQESKKHFWRLHAIASNQYLPQPFKVLKSVHDYKGVDFYNPAKHDKESVAVDSA